MNDKNIFPFKRTNCSKSNYILIIDALHKKHDINSANRIYEDIKIKLVSDPELDSTLIEHDLVTKKCETKQNIVQELDTLSNLCKQKHKKPIIIILGHGDKNKGLLTPSGESLHWKDLIGSLNKVTVSSHGETMVLASFCHSMELIKFIDFHSKLPFSFYYGYKTDISAGDVETQTNALLASLIDDGGKYLTKLLKECKFDVYSEYDHINSELAIYLQLANNPSDLAKVHPSFSLGKIRKDINSKANHPKKGLDKLTNNIIRSPILVKILLEDKMYDTERRSYMITAIDEYFNTLPHSRVF